MDRNQMLIELAKCESMYESVFKFIYNTNFEPDTDFEIKMALSKNKNVPVDILERLSREENSQVRASAMKHDSATEKMFKSALKDEDVTVRKNAINNKNIGETVLFEFLKDEDESVKGLTKKVLKTLWN